MRTYSVCSKQTDAEVMRLKMEYGLDCVPQSCIRRFLVTERTLKLRVRRAYGKVLTNHYFYLHQQLEGCQRCTYYKGEYPKPREG